MSLLYLFYYKIWRDATKMARLIISFYKTISIMGFQHVVCMQLFDK